MDLAAAIALMLLIEGLAIAIFAGSLPELVASLDNINEARRRLLGGAMVVAGALAYLLIRA
ncbi:MAG: DUF2065 family protein [Pseudomonadota bacterium]